MTSPYIDKPIGYLPIHCPCCGRRRVEATLRTIKKTGEQFVCAIACEKCGADEDWDHPAAEPGCSPSLVNGMPHIANIPVPLYVLLDRDPFGRPRGVLAATTSAPILEHILRPRHPAATEYALPWQGDDEALVWGLE